MAVKQNYKLDKSMAAVKAALEKTRAAVKGGTVYNAKVLEIGYGLKQENFSPEAWKSLCGQIGTVCRTIVEGTNKQSPLAIERQRLGIKIPANRGDSTYYPVAAVVPDSPAAKATDLNGKPDPILVGDRFMGIEDNFEPTDGGEAIPLVAKVLRKGTDGKWADRCLSIPVDADRELKAEKFAAFFSLDRAPSTRGGSFVDDSVILEDDLGDMPEFDVDETAE